MLRKFINPFELSTLNSTNGFVMNGVSANDRSGCSVAAAGDLNRDGVDDVIIGAYHASSGGSTYAGVSYAVFGGSQNEAWPASFELSTLNGVNGFVVNGVSQGEFSGLRVAAAGDLNGDGVGDVTIGGYVASPGERNEAGASCVVVVFDEDTPGSQINTLPGIIGGTVGRLTGLVGAGALAYWGCFKRKCSARFKTLPRGLKGFGCFFCTALLGFWD